MNHKDKIQQECLEAMQGKMRAGAVLGTGAGKTLLGIKHMASEYTDYATFLVVAPKRSIFEEWYKQCIEHGYEYLLHHIQFCTYLSLDKAKSEIYDVIYLDECHNLKAKHREVLTRSRKTVGLTGTYPKYLNSESGKLCTLFCPKVYEYTVSQGIEAGMLNNYKVYVHKLNLNKANTIATKKGSVTSEEGIYNMWCKIVDQSNPSNIKMNRIMRMKAIQGFQTKIIYAKKLLEQQQLKTIAFTDTIAQAENICVDSYHTKNKKSLSNLERFNSGEITKLSTVKQLSEGINIKDLEICIITHAYANEVALPQKLGRMLRMNPDKTAIIHILCYQNTVDQDWCKSSLKSLDPKKIFVWKNNLN